MGDAPAEDRGRVRRRLRMWRRVGGRVGRLGAELTAPDLAAPELAGAVATLDQALRLAAAVAAGAALGLNRNLRGKAAGVRTHALVALGAALVTTAAFAVSGEDAATRVMQGVITGIGFIGAGVILHPRPGAHEDDAAASAGTEQRRRRADVRGLTTAATVWVAAALGVVCGLGLWTLVVAGVLLTLLVLVAGGSLEAAAKARLRARRRSRRAAGRRA
jgi:putative Mg2+ transporter-C (MgtC) family protein